MQCVTFVNTLLRNRLAGRDRHRRRLLIDAARLVPHGDEDEAFHKAVDLLLQLRSDAKQNKDWAMCDKIRDELKAIGFVVTDTADGAEWKLD